MARGHCDLRFVLARNSGGPRRRDGGGHIMRANLQARRSAVVPVGIYARDVRQEGQHGRSVRCQLGRQWIA